MLSHSPPSALIVLIKLMNLHTSIPHPIVKAALEYSHCIKTPKTELNRESSEDRSFLEINVIKEEKVFYQQKSQTARSRHTTQVPAKFKD